MSEAAQISRQNDIHLNGKFYCRLTMEKFLIHSGLAMGVCLAFVVLYALKNVK